ncbi:MAG: hypothetical protein K0S86_766 [Geminicoccaceae bacterium]|nr:hypothetical protein [Geminicoccaceae bacterium]
MRTNRWTSCAAVAAALTLGCLDRRDPLQPDDSASRALAMALKLELRGGVAVGERVVEIRARYRRQDGEQPTLPVQPSRVALQDGEVIQQAVVVDIGPCNSDATREPNENGATGCRFAMELTLLNGAGEVLGSDEAMVGPVDGPNVPETPTFVFSPPTLALSSGGLTFSARSQQQELPAAQSVEVGVDIPGAAIGTLAATVTFNNGQDWLQANVDQGARAIVVRPATTALGTGSYSASVSVTSSVDGVRPTTFTVTYLIQPEPVLTVSRGGGNGGGRITSSPAGINCTITGQGVTGTCNATFAAGTVVSLTPAASNGSRFGGWAGACSSNGNCSVTMNQPATVSARFDALPVLTVTGDGGDGSGTITSSPAGISCTINDGDTSGSCSATFNPGTAVTLAASPSGRDRFGGWGGACSGSGSCAVTLNQSSTVTARFLAPSPVLALSPTSLSFTGVAGSSELPPRQTVTASNTGGGSLGAITIANIAYSSSASGWLDATISGATISVGANPANVPAGTHTATVTVRSANGGSATFNASFAVSQPPRLVLSPTSLSFSGVSRSPTPTPRQTVAISNSGSGSLGAITIANIAYSSSASGWLDATVSGATISVGANPANVAAGNHTATVTVRTVNAGTATFSASFAVSEPPRIVLSRTSLSFSGVSRSSSTPPRQPIQVSNGGGGSLGAITIASITYGRTASGWLDATVSGSTISVGAHPANVVGGNHGATVTVRSANGGSATFTVTFAVSNPPPRLGLDPPVMEFSALAGAVPKAQVARASNIGFGTFADLGPLSVDSKTTSWIRVSFDGDIVVVSMDPIVGRANTGTYAGTAVINSTRGGTATIAVSLTIRPHVVERARPPVN